MRGVTIHRAARDMATVPRLAQELSANHPSVIYVHNPGGRGLVPLATVGPQSEEAMAILRDGVPPGQSIADIAGQLPPGASHSINHGDPRLLGHAEFANSLGLPRFTSAAVRGLSGADEKPLGAIVRYGSPDRIELDSLHDLKIRFFASEFRFQLAQQRHDAESQARPHIEQFARQLGMKQGPGNGVSLRVVLFAVDVSGFTALTKRMGGDGTGRFLDEFYGLTDSVLVNRFGMGRLVTVADQVVYFWLVDERYPNTKFSFVEGEGDLSDRLREAESEVLDIFPNFAALWGISPKPHIGYACDPHEVVVYPTDHGALTISDSLNRLIKFGLKG